MLVIVVAVVVAVVVAIILMGGCIGRMNPDGPFGSSSTSPLYLSSRLVMGIWNMGSDQSEIGQTFVLSLLRLTHDDDFEEDGRRIVQHCSG